MTNRASHPHLKSNAYSAAAREHLRAVLIGATVEPDRAGPIVNAACDAVDRAMEALAEECGRAGAPGEDGNKWMALELAAQLLRERAQAIFERVHARGVAEGLPVHQSFVTLPD